MSLPEWVQQFREPKTEIKIVKGAYYKYEVHYKYNPEKKRTDKITGVLLGKITEEHGLIPSDKNKLRKKRQERVVDIKNYGLYHLFSSLIEAEFKLLTTFVDKDVCELLFSFAMFRWGYNSPIKRAPYYYSHDYCSEVFASKSPDDKDFSAALKTIGENRTQIVAWMRLLLSGQHSKHAEFVMMDSTHVFTKSELLTVNAKGYNPDFDFEKQVRLMYLFSAKMQQPVYYRLINGNITDITSMSLCVAEMNIDNVIYIADKGFYSKQNVKMMKAQNLQYIIPVRRDNKLISYKPLSEAGFKQKLSYFIYQNRIIWYYQYQSKTEQLITFLDEGLRAKEEADYASRITTLPEEYTSEQFKNKLPSFGTLTIAFDIKAKKSCEQVYEAYKQRNEIENVFDSYKNFLRADAMYMQNRYVLEGWLAANFIAMIAYHKLYTRLRNIKKLNNYSPKDIIEISKSIYQLKINNEWKRSEMTKKNIDLFKQLDIDYLNLRS